MSVFGHLRPAWRWFRFGLFLFVLVFGPLCSALVFLVVCGGFVFCSFARRLASVGGFVLAFFGPLCLALVSRRSVVSFWPFFLLFGVGFDPLCVALVFWSSAAVSFLRSFVSRLLLVGGASCWSVVSLWPFCYCLVWCWSFAVCLGFGRVRRFRVLFLCSAPRVKSLNLSLLI